jgi:hypothetical protein
MDNYVTFTARLDWPVKPWLEVGIGYDLSSNSSNRVVDAGTTSATGAQNLFPVSYLKHEVGLRLVVAY